MAIDGVTLLILSGIGAAVGLGYVKYKQNKEEAELAAQATREYHEASAKALEDAKERHKVLQNVTITLPPPPFVESPGVSVSEPPPFVEYFDPKPEPPPSHDSTLLEKHFVAVREEPPKQKKTPKTATTTTKKRSTGNKSDKSVAKKRKTTK